MNKHTEAPWYYEGQNIRNANGLDIASVDTERSTDRSVSDEIPDAEWEANARLIAAAPELYVALKALLEDHKRMFFVAHPRSTIAWEDCVEVQQALALMPAIE